MMNKTLKKGKRGSASETRKSFIVTESGLVEAEEEPNNPRRGSLLKKALESRGSITTKPMQDNHEGRERSGSEAEIPEAAEKLITDFTFRNRRRQSRNSILEVADAKLKTKNLLQKATDTKKQSDDEKMREAIQNNGVDAVDEIKAKFYSKNVESMMGLFTTTKAIAIMSSERRKRRETFKMVKYISWQII